MKDGRVRCGWRSEAGSISLWPSQDDRGAWTEQGAIRNLLITGGTFSLRWP